MSEERGGLIGRAGELGVLLAALDRAAEGQAGVVLVGGDAGVGKTRLVTALAGQARERGMTVLHGQCAELGEAVPYLPLADALWTASRDPQSAAAVAERPVLARLLPDGRPASGGEDVAGLAQQQLFGGVLGLLGELGDAHPVLFVLEDLHWADSSTRHLLNFLSRVLQRERVCLVGTYRTDDLFRRHPLRSVLAELVRLPNVETVALRPFGREELAGLLTALGGREPSAAEVERVYERSEGNPFYAEELYTADGGPLPAELADLLLSRVERLSDPAKRVIRVASVAGHRINDELVREVSGLDEAAYDAALREVVEHQLLVPRGVDGYGFRHALVAEAVYADLLPGERTRLHGRFAALLAARPHSAAELAFHRLAGHDNAGGLEASVAAGREATRLAAPAEAFEHYDRALELWDVVPDAERLAGASRIDLSLLAAQAAAHSGRPGLAVTRMKRLRELLDPAADPVLASTINDRLAGYLYENAADDEALATAEAAVDLLPAAPPSAERARALGTYTRSLYETDRHDDIPRLAEEAIAMARAAHCPDAEATALINLALHTEGRGALSEAEELFAKARVVAAEGADLSVLLRAHYAYARAEYDRAELESAARSVAEGVRLTTEAGLQWSAYGTNMRFLEYLVHYTTGDWDRAGELAAAFPVRVGTAHEATVSAYALFLEVAQGSPTADGRRPWLERFLDDDRFIGYIGHGLYGEQAAWAGDTEAALEHFRAALDAIPASESGSMRIAAGALLITTDPTRADELIERARYASRHLGTRRRGWLGGEGRAWLARAEAAWHRARGEDDPERWAAVVEAFDYGFPYELARSRYHLAGSLAEHGRREEAEREWRQATDLAARLGAAPLQSALAALGRRARFTTPEVPSARGLTDREREVLKLVATGRSNRDIAAALFISPKTASVHVSNILAKLGAATRTEAAAIAHRDGLT